MSVAKVFALRLSSFLGTLFIVTYVYRENCCINIITYDPFRPLPSNPPYTTHIFPRPSYTCYAYRTSLSLALLVGTSTWNRCKGVLLLWILILRHNGFCKLIVLDFSEQPRHFAFIKCSSNWTWHELSRSFTATSKSN